MQETTEIPTTASEATDGLAAAALRAEAWAGEPFLREGEDPAQALAPGTSRRGVDEDGVVVVGDGEPVRAELVGEVVGVVPREAEPLEHPARSLLVGQFDPDAPVVLCHAPSLRERAENS